MQCFEFADKFYSLLHLQKPEDLHYLLIPGYI